MPAKAIVGGTLVYPDHIRENGILLMDAKIRQLEGTPPADIEMIDAEGCYVCPGFIDVHIHGYLGEDATDGKAEGLRRIAEGIAKNGVTSFLPTTMTVTREELECAFDAIRTARDFSNEPGWKGAQILGVHAEGPFINPSKKGAQPEKGIQKPDAGWVRRHADVIRMMTYAPEMDCGGSFAAEVLANTDVRLSIGHSAADFDTAMRAVEAGVKHFTHTFNAMSGMDHRKPGVAAAALISDAYAELVGDTFHVDKAYYPMMAKLKGEKLVLITDCLRSGGLPDGEYLSGGLRFTLKGVECRLDDGTIAGSVLTMDQAVRNMVRYGGVPLCQAVAMASANAAASVGITEKGTLAVGKDADIVLLSRELEVQKVYNRGNLIYDKATSM